MKMYIVTKKSFWGEWWMSRWWVSDVAVDVAIFRDHVAVQDFDNDAPAVVVAVPQLAFGQYAAAGESHQGVVGDFKQLDHFAAVDPVPFIVVGRGCLAGGHDWTMRLPGD